MVGEGGWGQVIKSLGHYTYGPGLDLTDEGRFNTSQHMWPGLLVPSRSFAMHSEASTDFLGREKWNPKFLCSASRPYNQVSEKW